MSWKDAIAGALFNPDPAAQAAPKAGSGPVAPAPITAAVGPGLNNDMVQAIRKATFSRSTPFTAIVAAADKLATIIPDPVQRLKAAYATSSDGRTVQQIADAIMIHLGDVDSEELKFGKALEQANQTEVGTLTATAESKKQQIAANQSEIQQIQTRINTLNEAITSLTTEAAQLTAQASTKASELSTAEAQFKIAANAVRSELNGQKATILASLS